MEGDWYLAIFSNTPKVNSYRDRLRQWLVTCLVPSHYLNQPSLAWAVMCWALEQNEQGSLLLTAWVSNHMPNKVWDGIAYQLPTFNTTTVEVASTHIYVIAGIKELNSNHVSDSNIVTLWYLPRIFSNKCHPGTILMDWFDEIEWDLHIFTWTTRAQNGQIWKYTLLIILYWLIP